MESTSVWSVVDEVQYCLWGALRRSVISDVQWVMTEHPTLEE